MPYILLSIIRLEDTGSLMERTEVIIRMKTGNPRIKTKMRKARPRMDSRIALIVL